MGKPAGRNASAEMPITGHLQEFRKRLVTSVLFFILATSLSFYYSDILLLWIKRPLNAELVFLSPAEAFWSDMKVALFFGFLCSFPLILYELWLFVSPGLLDKERMALFPLFTIGLVFFFGGLSFCYWIALPFALNFLIAYGKDAGVLPMISVSNYIDFNLKMMLAFGLIFELPLVMVVLAKMGLLSTEFLTRNRRYAVLGAFLVAAIATPTPDIFNQIMMAVPLMVLYEVGIITVRIFAGKKSAPSKESAEGASG